jgi:hypothetical protein
MPWHPDFASMPTVLTHRLPPRPGPFRSGSLVQPKTTSGSSVSGMIRWLGRILSPALCHCPPTLGSCQVPG